VERQRLLYANELLLSASAMRVPEIRERSPRENLAVRTSRVTEATTLPFEKQRAIESIGERGTNARTIRWATIIAHGGQH